MIFVGPGFFCLHGSLPLLKNTKNYVSSSSCCKDKHNPSVIYYYRFIVIIFIFSFWFQKKWKIKHFSWALENIVGPRQTLRLLCLMDKPILLPTSLHLMTLLFLLYLEYRLKIPHLDVWSLGVKPGQRMWNGSCLYTAGFLKLSTIDIMSWMILCCGGLSCTL